MKKKYLIIGVLGAVVLMAGAYLLVNSRAESRIKSVESLLTRKDQRIKALEDSIGKLNRMLNVSEDDERDSVKAQAEGDAVAERYYDAKWLQRKFEDSEWKSWVSHDFKFVVLHPIFMKMNEKYTTTDGAFFEFHGITLIAKAYKDDSKMSVEQKFRQLSSSATSKSMNGNSFLIAGKIDDEQRYFEKDIKINNCWYYIRVEFPQEFSQHIDKLLLYVRDYEPFAGPTFQGVVKPGEN